MRLIVNADDLGYTVGVTRGILRAHRDGIVTSTTLMANAPDTEGAARLVRDVPTLDVGLHIVLTHGSPLSPPDRVPSLVTAEGRFPRDQALTRDRSPLADEVLVEARAQHARARELLGREPTHLDTHHWVHDIPAIEEGVARLAIETGAAVRSHDPGQRDRFRAGGIRTPDRFVREFQYAGAIGVETLVGLLERAALAGGTAELMCHPGEPDQALLSGSAYAAERGAELATLTSAAVRSAIARLGIELTGFGTLA